MEMKITKTVTAALLRHIEDLDSGRIDLEYLADVIKEYVLLNRRLLNGYLYYPAYDSYVGRAPYNCGPNFIGSVDDSLDKYDRKVGNEFNALCNKLTDQIADYVLSTIKEGKEEKAVEQPAENLEPKNPLRAAVEELNCEDVVFEGENAYLVLSEKDRDSLWPRRSDFVYTSNFLASELGWNMSQVWERLMLPLANGKILLTTEKDITNSSYRDALGVSMKSRSVDLKMDAYQKELYKILRTQPAAEPTLTSEPMYFQVAQKPASPFLDGMRFLWWGNVKGFNMASVDEIIINPMAEGRIYLVNDLPAAAKTVGRDYCEALKRWLNPLVWKKFIAKWNEMHPDVKI